MSESVRPTAAQAQANLHAVLHLVAGGRLLCSGAAYLGDTPRTYFENPDASAQRRGAEAAGFGAWWTQQLGGASDTERSTFRVHDGDQLLTEVPRTTSKAIARFKARKPEPPRTR